MRLKHYDDEAAGESFARRRDRRKPQGRRSVLALYRVDSDSHKTFNDPGLQALYERGYFSDILGELQSGKEANVYLAQGPSGLLAAKVYRDLVVRSFRNDQVYREGRFIGDARIKKAVTKRTRAGLSAQQRLWVQTEYRQLWELYQAGISVPKPMVGPGPDDISQAGRVVLMTFIGDDNGPAPRLSDLRLDGEAARDAFAQSLSIMASLLRLGKVHGDYSSYNLLWWQGRLVVIDFPQMVNIQENRQAQALLERDVRSLCLSFRKQGIAVEAAAALAEVQRLAGH